VIFVDTNVLVDVLDDDPVWADRSLRQLEIAEALGQLAINDIIYAELSVGYPRMDELDQLLAVAGIILMPIPRPALFLAGKAFNSTKSGVLAAARPGCYLISSSAPMRWCPMPR
jgi:predicted nucleic acid-binding protein